MKRNGNGRGDLDSGAKRAKVDTSNAPPSKVLFIGSLPADVSEGDVVQLGLPFGRMVAMILNRKKNQAFLEMADLEMAESMFRYYTERPPKIAQRIIQVRYSNYDHLKMESNAQNAGCIAALKAAEQLLEGIDEPKATLRIIIDNMLYPITLEILHKIFSKYGQVLRIVTFNKNNQFHAFVEFGNAVVASTAKNSLNGQNIYNGCCTLRVDFSKLDKLTVKYNNDKMWDFTNQNLPSGDGGHGGGNDGGMHGSLGGAGSGDNRRRQGGGRDFNYPEDDYGDNANTGRSGASGGQMGGNLSGRIGASNSMAGHLSAQDLMGNLGGNMGGMMSNLSGMGGNMSGMGGNISGMGGNLSGMGGNMSGMGGNMSGLSGNLSGMGGMTGNMGGMPGNMSGMAGNMGGNMSGILGNFGMGGNMGLMAGLGGLAGNMGGLFGNMGGSLGNMGGNMGNMGGLMGNMNAMSGMGANMNRMGGNMGNAGAVPSLLGNIPGLMGGNSMSSMAGGGGMPGVGNMGGNMGSLSGLMSGPGNLGGGRLMGGLGGSDRDRDRGSKSGMVSKMSRDSGIRREPRVDSHSGDGCVILVSNMDEERINPDKIFTLFGLYGDVLRVKILFNKKDSALVEYSTPEQAQKAVNNLHQAKWLGKEMRVSKSKHQRIMEPKEGVTESWLTKDFSNSPLHRFKNPHSKNFTNIYPPSSTLHLSNIPTEVSEDMLIALFGEFGKVVAFKFFQKDRKMAFIQMGSAEEATCSLVELHNYEFGPRSNLRVSFTQSTIRD